MTSDGKDASRSVDKAHPQEMLFFDGEEIGILEDIELFEDFPRRWYEAHLKPLPAFDRYEHLFTRLLWDIEAGEELGFAVRVEEGRLKTVEVSFEEGNDKKHGRRISYSSYEDVGYKSSGNMGLTTIMILSIKHFFRRLLR